MTRYYSTLQPTKVWKINQILTHQAHGAAYVLSRYMYLLIFRTEYYYIKLYSTQHIRCSPKSIFPTLLILVMHLEYHLFLHIWFMNVWYLYLIADCILSTCKVWRENKWCHRMSRACVLDKNCVLEGVKEQVFHISEVLIFFLPVLPLSDSTLCLLTLHIAVLTSFRWSVE